MDASIHTNRPTNLHTYLPTGQMTQRGTDRWRDGWMTAETEDLLLSSHAGCQPLHVQQLLGWKIDIEQPKIGSASH